MSRISTTIHMRPGDDDDLIEWLESVPNRNVAIKGLLRAALTDGVTCPTGNVSAAPPSPQIADLQREVNDLRTIIDRLLAAGPPPAPITTTVPDGEISDEHAARRAANLKKRKW